MLVLSRIPGERIILTTPDGYTIEILYDSCKKQRIRLAFTAPIEIKIMRKEIIDDRTPGTT